MSVVMANLPLLRMFPSPATISEPKIEPMPISDSRFP